MSLSGGAGFQSTQLIPRSFSVCANVSTASTLSWPGLATVADTSNSYVRYAPATSLGRCDLPSVQPNICAVIDSIEIQPNTWRLGIRWAAEIPCDTTTSTGTGCSWAWQALRNFHRVDSSCQESNANSFQSRDRDTSCRRPALQPPSMAPLRHAIPQFEISAAKSAHHAPLRCRKTAASSQYAAQVREGSVEFDCGEGKE